MISDSEHYASRLANLNTLRASGVDPYAVERYEATHLSRGIVDGFDDLEGQAVSIAGRLVSLRDMGGMAFADLQDEGGRIQLYAKKNEMDADEFERFTKLDIGDIVGVQGAVIKTKRGQISVALGMCTLLAKCLHQFPVGKMVDGVLHSGLTDEDMRHRMRYLDLIVNAGVRDTFVKRSLLLRAIRRFLDDRGYIEVETPVLQDQAGGAAARPFTTHHNKLDHDFKLRISLELFLKRLIVGGLPRVYEIGRVFRNEGVDTRHNPDFTLMELYQAYANLEDIMALVEDMYVASALAVNGTTDFTARWIASDQVEYSAQIDVGKRPWRRLPILDGIEQHAGVPRAELATLESARAALARKGYDPTKENTVGGIIEKLHEEFTQPHLVDPTFITDFPVETSPLAKKCPGNPALTRRFEVYVATQELGNAFSEINDPFDQRERFEDQLKQLAAGDPEAHPMDEDFLLALEYGMPPTGGLGIGIDRLAMLLSGTSSIREVILFPLLRQAGPGASKAADEA